MLYPKPIQDSSGVPLPIAPLGFRPNDTFLGFDIELDSIHTRLHGSKRRAAGTNCALVWGPPGCGKTHLVREYLWRHRVDYAGGTFWIDAKAEESRARGFWDIGQAAALIELDRPDEYYWDPESPLIDSVRKWFEARESWLIVFDGVSFDSDTELQSFMKFLPDSPDRQGNCIIFTSNDKTLAKRQRLLNPLPVKVHPLSIDDARELLFCSLDIRNPSASEAIKATELVRQYECLPLAIHAAAHALIARGTSLARYKPGSSTKRLTEPYLEILHALDEKQHVEAINLIRLLMFFNHNVPVALLMLGKKVLAENDVEIRSTDTEGSSKRELDNTIAVLIRHGLIERTLQHYQLNTTLSPEEGSATPRTDRSGSSTGSDAKAIEWRPASTSTANLAKINGTDGAPATSGVMPLRPESSLAGSSIKSITCSIDILRVHTVIQGVYRDEMKLNLSSKQKYWWWLGVAAKLLCLSYANTSDRIRREGLIRDYREYETQAAKMWSHFPKRPNASTVGLKSVRHELHSVRRAIKSAIRNESPHQSFYTLHDRVSISVFEKTSSSSSDGQDTPSSDLTRESTWSLTEDIDRPKSESPTSIRPELSQDPMLSDDDWDDPDYDPDLEDSLRSSPTTTRRSSRSEATEVGDSSMSTREGPAQRRPSFLLQGLFKGHPALAKKPKDLGEFKPLPVPPSISQGETRIVSSRGSSSDGRAARPVSAGSEAEAALAAVHRASPPGTRGRGSRIRSPNRSMLPGSISEDATRLPPTPRSPNLMNAWMSSSRSPLRTSPVLSPASTPHHSRQPSGALVSSASQGLGLSSIIDLEKDLPLLPTDPNRPIMAARPYDLSQSVPNELSLRAAFFGGRPADHRVTGYTSTPMSRDISKGSQSSLATAPAAIYGSDSASSALPVSKPPSSSVAQQISTIDTAAARDLEFGRIGDWAGTTPVTPATATFDVNGNTQNVQHTASVQFGQMSPVAVSDARFRAEDLLRQAKSKENGSTRPPR